MEWNENDKTEWKHALREMKKKKRHNTFCQMLYLFIFVSEKWAKHIQTAAGWMFGFCYFWALNLLMKRMRTYKIAHAFYDKMAWSIR